MKTCFVISPIGMEASDVRKNADDLFDLIIQPALEIFNFKVIRGDMVTSSTSITDDVIKMIQNSELCIIDLTGQNPNVFYECGRRHETAKPFILIKRKGEEIPFDLKNMRTVDYDLSDPRKTKISIDSLRKFVNEFEAMGYESESSIATLSSIANALVRIERKIEMLGSSAPAGNQSSDINVSGSPARVFYNAMDAKDTTTAVKALKKFMQISADINMQLDMASLLVEAYEPAGVPIVRTIIENEFDNIQPSKLAIALFGLYTYANGALTLSNEYDYLKNITLKALERPILTVIEKAAYYNVLASIEYSMKNDMQSLHYYEQTVELVPDEPAYNYNIARTYRILNKNDELIGSLNNIIRIYQNKDPKKDLIKLGYLEYARDIFSKMNIVEKVNEIDDIINNAKKYPENVSDGI